MLDIPAPLEVPFLVLEGNRLEFDYGSEKIDFEALGPLASLGMLASTQCGFLRETAPDFRFPAPLDSICELCTAAAVEYAKQDKDGFRAWLTEQSHLFAERAGDLSVLRQHVEPLSLSQREMLMIPLIYLNHMWRQGSPVIEPAKGPSRMPDPLHALMLSLSEDTRIIPRFNQIIMTMRAWRLDGKADGEPTSYRELTALDRMDPYFWMNTNNESERNLYRAFFAVETFGIPLYGWGCLALECAERDDVESAVTALAMVRATLRNVYTFTKHMIPRVTAEEFRKIQVTGGWIEDDVTGVASGYQLPFMLMMDSLFHVNFTHAGVIEARRNNLRFVPEHWKGFFRMIYDRQPALKTWVHEKGSPELTEAYQSCVNLFTLFRSMHKHLGGQVIKGSSTTGRAFASADDNYRQFIDEMSGLITDTAAAGDTSAPAAPDIPAAAASRGERRS
ncbi:hypothetical protein [Pendulispora albinea]|uniref:Indoleamine 2,3-dioxygenase n=1 Tax=Pendulispora albinea TaxID=2741071 RepID=A0ABZ2M5D7_9BACT